MMKKTKTSQSSRNFSNNVRYHFMDGIDDTMILGANPFGNPDIDMLDHSYEFGNLQSILKDIMSITFSGIGDIVTKTENITPAGYSQIDQWTFDGTGGILYDTDTEVELLGKRMVMSGGFNMTNVVTELYEIIQGYVADGIFFSKVDRPSNLVLEVEYNDRRIHNPTISSTDPRLNADKRIVREMTYGYGQWVYLGTESKKIGTVTRPIYYFERVG